MIFPGFTLYSNSRFGQAVSANPEGHAIGVGGLAGVCGRHPCEDKICSFGATLWDWFRKTRCLNFWWVSGVCMHLLQALRRKWLNWLTAFGYSQGLPCNSIRGLDRPGFGNSGKHPIGVGGGVVGCGVRETSFVRTTLQFWGNFVRVVSLNTQLEFWCVRVSVHALVASIEGQATQSNLLISDTILRVYPGIQSEVLTARPGFCNSGRACNWCCVVGCGVPEATLWGQQVSRNFVKTIQLEFGLSVRVSMDLLQALN